MSLILSLIDYGDMLYDGANKKDLNHIQNLQNRLLRIISQCQRYKSNIVLHRQYNIVPLYIRHKANQVKAMRNNLIYNSNKNRMLDQQVDRVTYLLSAPFLDVVQPHSKKFQKSCSYFFFNTLLANKLNTRRLIFSCSWCKSGTIQNHKLLWYISFVGCTGYKTISCLGS